MNLVSGIKRTENKKGRIVYVSTDGRKWDNAMVANEWQKSLNKKVVKVLKGKAPTKPTVKKAKRVSHGKGGNVGMSPEKRRAVKAFVIKHNISLSAGSGNLISMNRLLWAMNRSNEACKEFAALFGML